MPPAKRPASKRAPAKKKVASVKKAGRKTTAKKATRKPAAARPKVARRATKTEMKTKPTTASVDSFLDRLDPGTRQDCLSVITVMRGATGAEPRMWGASIVGFGDYHYAYESGREGDWFLTGFSPRKQNLTLYLSSGFAGHDDLLGKLGKFKTAKSCLYVKRLSDVDLGVLEKLVERSVARMKARV